MKHLLICVSVLAAVSVSSAKSFKITESGKRNPAQTGNIGPAAAKPEIPASVVCHFSVNGSGGPIQNFPIAVKGSELTENLEASTKAELGEASGVTVDVSIRQVFESTYATNIWIKDDATGVQSLNQDFVQFPATMQSSSISAMLLFSKNIRTITINGKKVELKFVQAICALERKKSI